MDNSNSESEVFLKNPLQFVELFYRIGIERKQDRSKDALLYNQDCGKAMSEESCLVSGLECIWIRDSSSSMCHTLNEFYNSGVNSKDDLFEISYRHRNASYLESPKRIKYVFNSELNRYTSWSNLNSLFPATLNESLPSHIVLFESHLPDLYVFLLANNYQEQDRFFHSVFDSSRHMLLYSRNNKQSVS
jgi:hypothetical protein